MSAGRLALVGCYTTQGAPGLQSVRVRPGGDLEPLSVLAMESPSCVIWHPSLPVAYATNETAAGGVTAVSVDDAGGLHALGTAPTGGSPCHAAIAGDGRWLLTADYTGGSVSLVELAPDGTPRGTVDTLPMVGSGPVADRQEQAHPHMIATDVLGDLLICVDLGSDRLTALAISGRGELRAEGTWSLPAGTGPRQVVTHPDGRTVLVLGELSGSLLQVELGASDEAVVLTEVPTTSRAERSLPAQLTVHGDHVLVSNRGPDTIALLDARTPTLEQVAEVPTGGRWPRHFAVADGLLLVSDEDSSTIETLELGTGGEIGLRRGRFATFAPTWVALQP